VAARSHQLYIGRPASGTSSLYTVPAGTTTLLKAWQATNGGASAALFALSVYDPDLAEGELLHPLSLSVASFGQLTSDHWVVLKEGQIIQCATGAAGFQVIISGAELEA